MNRRIVTALAAALFGLVACDPADSDPMTDDAGGTAGDDDDDAEDAGVDAGADQGADGPDSGDDDDDDDDDDSSDDDDDDDDDSSGDDDDDDDSSGGGQCDPFSQDCADGEKCMPWADDGGGSWNATKCVPIAEDAGQVGDPCVVEGSGVSGVDNCDAGLMCYYVSAETNEGVCTGLCEGNPGAPSCNDGFSCEVYNDGVLPLCLEECDPLLQTCSGPEQLCVAGPANDGFVCILDSLPTKAGVYGAPCAFANACDPGLFCAVQQIVPGCTNGGGCCSEFCDLAAPDPNAMCSGSAGGQTCQPWWNAESPAPGYENVGYCGVPQ